VPDSAQAGGQEEGAGRGRSRRSRWLDTTVGVVLGIVLGIAVIVGFVFYGSEGTIDAPRISGVNTGKPGTQPVRRVPLVVVRGGAPPPRGPALLSVKQGRRAIFVVDSDQSILIQIPGYGIQRSLGSGRTTVSFLARKPGQYPVVVSPSQIAIATLRVAHR